MHTHAYTTLQYTAIYMCTIAIYVYHTAIYVYHTAIYVYYTAIYEYHTAIHVYYAAIYVYYILQYIIQWNLYIEDTLTEGHLSNEYRVCCPNHIELCTNLPLN